MDANNEINPLMNLIQIYNYPKDIHILSLLSPGLHNLSNRHLNETFLDVVFRNHLPLIEWLLVNKADVSYKNNAALKHCVAYNQLEAVYLLFNYGVTIDAQDTGLIFSCIENGDYYQMLAYLISKGLNVVHSYHALYNACLQKNRLLCANLLIGRNFATLSVTDNQSSLITDNEDIVEYKESS